MILFEQDKMRPNHSLSKEFENSELNRNVILPTGGKGLLGTQIQMENILYQQIIIKRERVVVGRQSSSSR